MSFYNDGDRQDLATRRVMLIGQSGKNAAGDKFYTIHPWEYVEYANGIGGFEPKVMASTNAHAAFIQVGNSDRHPTSIEFIGDDDFVLIDRGQPITGGNTGFPRR